MALKDSEIRDEMINLVSNIYADGRITERESNALLFYGLYNNSWCENHGMKHPNDIETLMKSLYPNSQSYTNK